MVPLPLGGEADPNAWHFAASHGPLPNPVGHTFPLMSHDAKGMWRLIGTGFYVSADGLFVTAKHVIEDVWTEAGQTAPLAILHLRSESGLFGPQEYSLRPIVQCRIGDSADVALGVAAQATHNVTGQILSHWSWPITWVTPQMGTKAATYAFPNHAIQDSEVGQTFHFRPDLYAGTILEVGDFRDAMLVPYPYVQVDFHIHHAASGGPVVGPDGSVIGVNCRYMDPAGPGVVAQIRCLEAAYIDDAVLPGELGARRVTFPELVAAGAIRVNDYVPRSIPAQPGRTIRFEIPIAARGPNLQFSIYT